MLKTLVKKRISVGHWRLQGFIKKVVKLGWVNKNKQKKISHYSKTKFLNS